MNLSIFVFIIGFVCLINISQSLEYDEDSWLFPCSFVDCNYALQECYNIKCFGVNQCKRCVMDYNTYCSTCVDKIFDPFVHHLTNDNRYKDCDSKDQVQVKSCQLFCRGNFFNKGNCENNYCSCNN
jgi:hypothetical protein